MASSRHPTVRRKRFGQHFLASAWARKIVQAIDAQPGDVFVEIGPGTGALTLPLARTGAPVLAVEIDRDLVADLAARVPRNVTLLTGDFLNVDVTSFMMGLEPQRAITTTTDASAPNMPVGWSMSAAPPRRFRVVGNLPYNISSPLLFRLVELYRQHNLLFDATIMLQREVADRLLADPGSKDYGVLSVTAQVHARMSRVMNLPPGAFSPPPKVDSTVVRMTFGAPSARIVDEVLFERLVRAVFSQRRKTVRNTLKQFHPAAIEVLAKAGIDGGRRPETLQVTEIARLVELFAAENRAVAGTSGTSGT